MPGYLTLLKNFLIEMKKKEPKDYSDEMINTSLGFLNNPRLLSVMMTIIFKKIR